MKRVNELRKYLRINCISLCCAAVAVLFAACILGGDIDEWRDMAEEANGKNKTEQTFTVTFEANGGTPAPAARTVAKGDTVTQPLAMTRTGFDFGGWYDDEAFTYQWDFTTDTVTGDITLHAKWDTIPGMAYFDVTFEANGGTPTPAVQTVAEDGKATEPEGITKDGHTLDGWFEEAAFTNKWNFATNTVTGNITLYAKWNENPANTHTVTFVSNTENHVPDQVVTLGGKATEPGGIAKIGHTLDGWYREAAFTNKWNFAADTVTANITLYAKWDINRYTITFGADGGTPAPAQQTVDHGGNATEPPAMTKSGHTFGGWYKEAALANQWNFAADTVVASITLYAKWEVFSVVYYTVTFEANYGTSVPAQSVAAGGKVTEPADITRTSFTLDGWYREAAFTNKWNFATDTVTGNITLYAKWDIIPGMTYYTVGFNSNGGTPVYLSQIVVRGGKATEPVSITRPGFTLVGWYRNQALTQKWNFDTDTVTSVTPLFAKWDEIPGTVYYTVFFKYNSGNQDTNLKVAAGTTFPAPTAVRISYVLDGWYTEAAFINKWNFDTDTVTGNITLYAKWLNSVSFAPNGGTPAPASQSIAAGGKVMEPAPMTRTGYTFDGWYTEAAFINEWNFDTDTVTDPIQLSAKWLINYTVLFYPNAGTPAPTHQTIPEGGKVTEPAITRNGCTLDGWYTEEAFTNKWNFATSTVTADVFDAYGSHGYLRLYAKWEIVGLEFELITSGSNANTYRVRKGAVDSGSVVIPSTYNGRAVTEIGAASDTEARRAFSGTAITSITIPASVTSIGGGAFEALRSLTVTFAANSRLTTIGDRAFYESGPSIEIPASVTSIGNSAFYNSGSGVTFAANSQLKTIGDSAFYGFSRTSLDIPANVTSIGNSAFSDSSFATVTFATNSQLATIGDRAFYNCTRLTSIDIPASVTSIGERAFTGAEQLAWNNLFHMNLATVKFAANSQLKTIGDYAFANSPVAGIILPASVTSISDAAFYNCTRLTSIDIPASVTSIGVSAFSGARTQSQGGIWFLRMTLDSVTFAANGRLETIGAFAFANTPITSNIALPASVTSIGDSAFANTTITGITIPANVTDIGVNAFDGCTYLYTVTFAANSKLETIRARMFYGCTRLAIVTFEPGSRLVSIGDRAFQRTDLYSINIPASVKTIGGYNLIGDIEYGVFRGLSSLRVVTFDAGSQLETIGDFTFENCDYIANITIPASVINMGRRAFYTWGARITQTIYVAGHANYASTVAAWGTSWSGGADVVCQGP